MNTVEYHQSIECIDQPGRAACHVAEVPLRTHSDKLLNGYAESIIILVGYCLIQPV
jgi:hypothetical protein